MASRNSSSSANMVNKESKQKLHIVMFPWLAFGHLMPYLELSKCLAQKGLRISFVSTPRNIQRLPKIPTNLSPLITFVELSLPNNDHNLPDNAEATIDVPYDKVEYLKKAYDGLQDQLTSFLETNTLDWIIYDFAPHWLPPIVAKLDIPCVCFTMSTTSGISFAVPPNGEDKRTQPDDFTVPPEWISFPSNMAFRLYEILKVFNAVQVNVSGVSDLSRAVAALQGCDIVAVRTCNEIESEWLQLAQKVILKKPVIPIGLLPPSPGPDGQEKDEKWLVINEWLNKQDKKSVVYVAFGSEAILSQEETTELALGLEQSELPFFWVFRRPVTTSSTEDESDPDMLPDGFEERTRGRGFVWRDWVPQLLILAHPSVGCYLNHSGWSSIIESLGLGCPLVLFPVINDQALVARLMVSKEMGFELPRDEQDGSFSKESVAKTLRMVVVDKEGEPYRAKAKVLREVFGDIARHDQYIEEFVNYLKGYGHPQ